MRKYLAWSLVAVLSALVMVATAFPTAASAAADLPFRAQLSGTTVDSISGGMIRITATNEGIATHLGRTEMVAVAIVTPSSSACTGGAAGAAATFTITTTLTAANGDMLLLSGSGTACLAAGHSLGSATYTVNGGTGRFSDATGTITQTFDHNLIAHTETVSLEGTLSLH